MRVLKVFRLLNKARFLVIGFLVLSQSCSKRPKSIQETAPDAVYDTYANSKAFPVVASGDQPMIDDLEDGDLNGLRVDGRHWSWSQFDDESDGVQLLTIQKLADAPGKGDQVLYVKGGGWKYNGAGLSAYLVNRVDPRPFGYYDASIYQGIAFWIKALGPKELTLRIGTQETTSLDNGGICIKNCADDPEFSFKSTGNWQFIKIPFQNFLLPGFDFKGLLDPSGIKAIHFSIDTLDDYELWIDDLSFYND
ncbi:MAG: hypothetical protein O3C20_14190 [Verrucomicrobia bacterium]|nr:hypothetical protein [Verrucomicrobiota bacterium]